MFKAVSALLPAFALLSGCGQGEPAVNVTDAVVR